MSDWTEDKIKEFADSFAGGTPSRTRSDYFNGTIPWISSSEVNQEYIIDTAEKITQLGFENSSAKWIPKNSVLIAMYGATAGQVSKNLIEATSNQAVLALIPKKECIDSSFLYYQVKQHKESILFLAQGSGQPNLSKDLIDNFIINVPKQLPEQRRIAKILTTTDAVIEKTQAAIAKYKAIKQGMLHNLFTRGIDPATNKLRPCFQEAPDLYKESKLGWIPKEWKAEKIGDFAFVTKLAGFEYTMYFDYSKSGPIIAVRALNIKQGKLDLTNIHTIPKETSELLTRSQLKNGDLVISYVGTVGEVAVIMEDNKYHLAPNVAKITVEKNEIDPFYLNQFLNSNIGQNEIIKMVSSTTQAALSMQNLREVNFIKPKIEEQKIIEKRLNGIDNKLQSEQVYLNKLQQIKRGLMEDLLSGRKKITLTEQ